jgi:AcrR family transcriptional regulator
MTVSYADRGRTNQKRRTRTAVLDAAVKLVREGRTPSVTEAARAASVSRATAYRYFPTQEALLVEAAISGADPTMAGLMGPFSSSDDAEVRVAALVESLTAFMVEHDTALRMMLKVSIDRSLENDGEPVRAGRRAAFLEEALAPLKSKLSAGELRRLNAALGMVIGTEALLVLRDVYDFEAEEARALMRWAASALFSAATRVT